MSVLFVILPVVRMVVLGAVLAYAWAARRGQFDDLDTPALRMLHDEVKPRRRDAPDGPPRGARRPAEEENEMSDHAWVEEFPGAITVCDPQGVILAMNERAARGYAADGGRALIGRNVLDSHPEPARGKLAALLATRQPNVYTIEKAGVKKLIYQSPWFQGGEYAGVIELALEIPFETPHFVRAG